MNSLHLSIDQLVVSGTTAFAVEPELFQEMLAAEIRRHLPQLMAERAFHSDANVRMGLSTADLVLDDLTDMHDLASAIARGVAAIAVDASNSAGAPSSLP